MLAYVGVPKIWRRFVQLQVPHKLLCPRAPAVRIFWGEGTCPRQFYGAGAYEHEHFGLPLPCLRSLRHVFAAYSMSI